MNDEFLDFLKLLIGNGTLSVDGQGRIWRHKKKHRHGKYNPCEVVRAENKSRKGYLRLTLQFKGKLKCTAAHRVVWMVTNGAIPLGLEINHKNGVKDDNRLENLELVTSSENSTHAVKSGLRRPPWSVTSKEGRIWWVPGHPRSGAPLLRNEELALMIEEVLAGARVSHVARKYGINRSYLGYLFQRKTGQTTKAYRNKIISKKDISAV